MKKQGGANASEVTQDLKPLVCQSRCKAFNMGQLPVSDLTKRKLVEDFPCQPKILLLPQGCRGGTDLLGSQEHRTGRTGWVTTRRGHFQGLARQLTS